MVDGQRTLGTLLYKGYQPIVKKKGRLLHLLITTSISIASLQHVAYYTLSRGPSCNWNKVSLRLVCRSTCTPRPPYRTIVLKPAVCTIGSRVHDFAPACLY